MKRSESIRFISFFVFCFFDFCFFVSFSLFFVFCIKLKHHFFEVIKRWGTVFPLKMFDDFEIGTPVFIDLI